MSNDERISWLASEIARHSHLYYVEALLLLFFFPLTSFEAEAKQTRGQQIPISAKHQRVHCV